MENQLNDAIDAIWGILALGGPVVALLLALSVFAVALIALKLFQFWRRGLGRLGRAENAVTLWRAGRHGDALAACADSRSIISRSLEAGMTAKLDGADAQTVESEATRVAGRELHDLQKGFRTLDAIAQISPLLGLFGTVLGMIEAFQAMQSAGAAVDPSVLAGGIWVALLTTAVGLAVAMPVSIVLTMLETRVDNERAALEDLVTQWLNEIAETGSVTVAALHAEGRAGAPAKLAHAH
ncbi:MotA/TolQ/ExbB proton channel family protein [Pelagibacterium sp. 26DY04]|uniref:MotA/TolQ/ExbB proton channel family protein n=1 Tax=Pelagibacterium sp. 26DY04 TaxID=2967130 RepID=UPI0028168A12|nr:MotA/TolQ/ExbB proton channel family protein [Pelagibacterium sp. 26DY04]WMT87957.1 MotA/TolQ/ExbB proton channel family protein [Pelagibacterium sp. 26DY04]